MRTSRLAVVVAAAIGFAGLQSAALASIIDLRDLPGNFDQFSWGQPDTTIYAQSIVADDVVLNEFIFRAGSTSGTDILYNIIVTGDRSDAGGGLGLSPDFNDIRYTSGNLSIGPALTKVTVNPNIIVANGETLFFVLNTFSFPTSGSGFVRATEFNGAVDQYVPGEFVFLNTGGLGANTLQDLNAFNWSHRFDANEDLAISVTFRPIPGPGAIALVGLAGLAGFGRRRRR